MPCQLVTEAAARLWTPEGANALDYLRGRGLTEETIRAARLGWTPGVSIPDSRTGTRFWRVSGIVIPWLDGDRLALVKIRQPEGSEAEVRRSVPRPPDALSSPLGRSTRQAAGRRARGNSTPSCSVRPSGTWPPS